MGVQLVEVQMKTFLIIILSVVCFFSLFLNIYMLGDAYNTISNINNFGWKEGLSITFREVFRIDEINERIKEYKEYYNIQ